MTKTEYLNNLEQVLIAYKIDNYQEIVDKYRKRFELATMADMTEEEAIKMMGSVESVVRKYANLSEETTYTDIYNLKIDNALAEEIIVEKTNKQGIVINVDEELADRIKINNIDKKITISDKFGKSFFRKAKGRIFIEVGPNIKFDLFEINSVSCDVKICDIEAKTYNLQNVSGDYDIERITAETVRLTTVSGDYDISRIKATDLRISTVSGDAVVNYLDVVNAIFDTISGDISVSGKIKFKKGSSISGNINYTEIK